MNKVETIKLDNGLTIYLYEDKRRHFTFFDFVTLFGGMDKDFVLNINSVFPKADIGFFIDITPEESVNWNTDTKFNIKSSVEHLGEVRKAYSSILNENNLIYIDGMKPIEQIFNEVLQKLEEFRKNNAKRIWSTNITIKKMWNL